ncbi:plant virulence effector HPE1-like domain-containing protein [Hoeflea alexandrii]|uniref:plant virulence effector HPE1-like domain-containing protein n=1 Tax=Hoeflea alexandrii TaxID=288436 RepID=UPI0022AF60D7|nr:plant virulence effector HPE1-like domain-containing protein [Hoeflea alexandrii]MCZ4288330.1 plant virulence effector HPE1-like domain-containing protein [Hoeflea alexandrii]
MQRLIIAAAVCMGAGTAGASSIEPYTPSANTKTSIVEIGCPSCAREAAAKAAEEAQVKLAPGEQIVEVHEVGGKMMIYRTENLLGGSPVTMVRKASEADLIALGVVQPETNQVAETDAPAADGSDQPLTADASDEPKLFEPVIANSAPGIDAETMTSALSDAPQAEFDPSKYELRLN